MTPVTSTSNSFFLRCCCPCDCTKITKTLSTALPWIGVAISIVGAVATFFSQLWLGTIGFSVCALLQLRSVFSGGSKDISELKEKIEKSDQLLIVKQEEIVSLTKKLENIQKSAQKTQQDFDKQLAKYKDTTSSLKKTIDQLPKEQANFAKKNQQLEKTVTALTKQVANSKVVTQELERQIQEFITQHQRFVPQLDQLSAATQGLEGTEKRLRGTLSGFNQELTRVLEDFSFRLQAWQLTTEKLILENRKLSEQVSKFESLSGKVGKAASNIERTSETYAKNTDRNEAAMKRIESLLEWFKNKNILIPPN